MSLAAAANADDIVGKDDRDFIFTARDFDRVRKLIHEKAGISLSESKRDMVYSRLGRRLRALGGVFEHQTGKGGGHHGLLLYVVDGRCSVQQQPFTGCAS